MIHKCYIYRISLAITFLQQLQRLIVLKAFFETYIGVEVAISQKNSFNSPIY